MRAKFPGRCACTGQPINPGDEVQAVGTSPTGRTLWALVSPQPAEPPPIPVCSARQFQAALRRHYRRTTP